MTHTPFIALLIAGMICVGARAADDTKNPDNRGQGKHDPSPPSNADVPKLSVEEFDRKRREKDTVVLDVRTPEEFKAGHVPGAVNLDVGDKEFDKKLASLDKNKAYLVHCARGGRSAKATAEMRSKFDRLYDFSGGFSAWQKAGKPVEK